MCVALAGDRIVGRRERLPAWKLIASRILRNAAPAGVRPRAIEAATSLWRRRSAVSRLDQSPAVKFWSQAHFAPDSSSVPAARILLVIVVVIPIVAAVAIPTMVVGHLAVTAIPVAFIEALPIMTRFHPAGSCVCRPSPVSVVPLIVFAHRIPVARDPRIAGARSSRLNSNGAHRWRRPDSHPDGQLREGGSRRQHSQCNQFDLHD